MLKMKLINYTILALILSVVNVSYSKSGVYTVKDFGAKANGIADDTDAFIKAIEKASKEKRGAKVLVPAGEYKLTKTLTLEGVLLYGLDEGAWPADIECLPKIIVDNQESPCIIAKAGASIHGLNFSYYHKDGIIKFPPTIQISGVGVSITNIRMQSPFDGIIADGKSNIARLNLENVFINNAMNNGIFITGGWDAVTLRNVEVWNIAEYAQQNCTAFKFGFNDVLRLSDCFAFACKIGYHFMAHEHEPNKDSTWGSMANCFSDFSGISILIDKVMDLAIIGGSFWTHGHALKMNGEGRVVMTGADIKGNIAPAIDIENCTSVTITGCNIGKANNSWPDIPNARINNKNGTVMIGNCTFDNNSKGIEIGSDADNFSITNNIFKPSSYESIIDNSSEKAYKIINNNLVRYLEKNKNTK